MTEKLKFRVEFNDEGEFKFVRPHRVFYGKSKKALPAELEFEEHEDVYGVLVQDGEDTPGRSCRVPETPGLVLTSDPALYGTDADRKAAGKQTLKKLNWGEWNLINDLDP